MLNKIFKKAGKKDTNTDKSNYSTNDSPLTDNLKRNMADFKQFVGISHDVNNRALKLAIGKGIDAEIIYIEGLVDKEIINTSVINALVVFTHLTDLAGESIPSDLINIIKEKAITNAQVTQSDDWNDIIDKLFSGNTILLVDGLSSALVINTRKWADRGVEETTMEQVIRGPRDSFSETLVTNTMLLRRRIKSPKLQFEYTKVGALTKTDIIIAYINGVVNPKLVGEVRSRINRIETDGILESNMIEEFIEDNPFAIFPQINNTERPDKAAAHLLEGGVVVLVDATPVVLMLPVTFWQFLYSPEDYYERVYTSFLIRGLRFITMAAALALPSFYIAVTSFHQEMIPAGLLEVIVSGRRGIPFPILLEVLLMEFILEVIREAGVRLPRNVGQAISIVGALVLGQAAIQAKLASPTTVTVVAITAIANFTIPAFSIALSMRYLRFALMIVSGTFGILGFICLILVLFAHMCSLRSFGVPFLAPFAPAIPTDFKDTVIRAPVWAMSKRPRFLGSKDYIRQKDNLKPGRGQKDRKHKGGRNNA